MTEPRTAAAGHSAEPDAADPEAPPAGAGDTGATAAGTEAASETNAPAAPRRRLTQIMWAVAFVAFIAGLAVAAVGFALSYNTLVDAARGWGFGERGSYAFPIGIDGLIIALYSIDLVLVWRKMPKPFFRVAAHATTAVTIALNVAAAADSAPGSPGVWAAVQADPGRLLSHAAMPVAYVLLTEAARHLISRTARLEEGRGTLTLSDWLLAPRGTWRVWRLAKLWRFDYDTVRQLERERAVHRVWLQYRQEIEAAQQHAEKNGVEFTEDDTVTVLDRLPDLLAPYGVTVDEALALPDRMRREEQQRRAERDRATRELKQQEAADRATQEHADRLSRLTAEAEELRAQGEVDMLRAQVDGERQAAEHRAAAAADTAGIEAAAARSAAERAATEAQRRADAEEEAEESARTAAARRKAAEDEKSALTTEQQNLRRRLEISDAQKRAVDTEAEVKRKGRLKAEDEAAAAAALRQAEEDRAAAARAELAAVANEDTARLSERERNIRRVARLIIIEAGGDALRLPLARVEDVLGVANGTASGYRTEAAQLIKSGYDHRTDPLYEIEQEPGYQR
ncbi:DUF2637 domain-containing protein [Streptomyces virginiae]|uniref:DUF2637 domain-containing protein n=1 Tax=Streptomyces virginiae TaxID=1961 RepID=UPI0036D0EB7D